jgi:hypothetical protein
LPNSGLAAFFQATMVAQNVTTITTTSHPVFAGLGATITLNNPGWGVFSQSYNPGGSTGLGPAGTGYGVVLGNNGQTLLNAALFDSYASLSQGQQFVANEITFLASAAAVSVPAASGLSLAVLGALLAISAALVLRRGDAQPIA